LKLNRRNGGDTFTTMTYQSQTVICRLGVNGFGSIIREYECMGKSGPVEGAERAGHGRCY